MNPTTNFQRNRELVKWWVSIARDDRFELVITHAKAILMSNLKNSDQIQGVESLIATLETMTDNPEGDTPFPTPGLIHYLDSPSNRQTDKPSKKGK